MPRDVRGETRREPREFREEDREKLVVAPGGVMLGWGDDNDADESTREIGPEHVDRYEEDRIYLRDRS